MAVNPHKSFSKLNLRRVRAEAAVLSKANKHYNRAVRLQEQHKPLQARVEAAKGQQLMRRAHAAGRFTEGPIGQLPNGFFTRGIKRFRVQRFEQERQKALANVKDLLAGVEARIAETRSDPIYDGLPKRLRTKALEREYALQRKYKALEKDLMRQRNGIVEAAAGLQALEYIGSKAKRAGLGSKPKFNPGSTISEKIAQLRREGYPQKQAVAVAFSEKRAGKIKQNPSFNWQAVRRFNFTYAIPDGAWLEDANKQRDWFSFTVIKRHMGEAWLNRQLRKQGQFTGTWIDVDAAHNPRRKGSRDALGVWHPEAAENPLSDRESKELEHLRKRMYELETQRDAILAEIQRRGPRNIGKTEFKKLQLRFQRLGRESKSMFKRRARLGRKLAQRNPSVTEVSRMFQGEANGAVTELDAPNSAPKDLARIGRFVFLKLTNGYTLRIPRAMVAVDTKGRLWLVGKGPLLSRKAKRGERLDYGEITSICYDTAKSHIGDGKRYEYVHEFGEDGGRRPRLQVDHEGMPLIVGGDYRIESRGIVN